MALQEVAAHLIELWDRQSSHSSDVTIREGFRQSISAYSQEDLTIIGDAIKEEIIKARRKSKERALHLIQLLFFLADITNHKLLLAIGLHARGFIFTNDEKEYEKALGAYEKAADLYLNDKDLLRFALMNVTKVWALAAVGEYQAAFEIGEKSEEILAEAEKWRDLANLYNNLAGIYVVRLGQYQKAIELLNKAQKAYEALGESGQVPMLASQFNEAMLLRYLGDFHESIRLNQLSIEKAKNWDLVISAARGQQTLGTTYFITGEFNKAIQLMEDARASYLQDKREHDAILVDLSLSTGLLNLGQFQKTIEISERVVEFCKQIGVPSNAMRATYNMGLAYLELNDLEKAYATLQIASEGFRESGNLTLYHESNIGLATTSFRQKNWETCLLLAGNALKFFEDRQLIPQLVKAALIVGRAGLAMNNRELVSDALKKLEAFSQAIGVPTIRYPIYHFLGECAHQDNRTTEAIEYYYQAIDLLESLQGQVITELRADFLFHKQAVYEELVALYIENGNRELALEIAERAKSRTLLSMLTQRFSPRISVKKPADQFIADTLIDLRKQRDTLYLSWQGGEYSDLEEQGVVFQKIRTLEEKITSSWHQLLVRDANYEQDRTVWQVYVEDARKHLDGKSAIVEYYSCQGQFVVFLISQQDIQVQRLESTIDDVKALYEFFWMNLNAVQRIGKAQAFLQNAQSLLQKAYEQLFAPIAQACENFENLIIVPHGPLHYFPIHALFDGEQYLIQKFSISYLPGSSFLGVYRTSSVKNKDTFVLGNSFNGQLPHTVSEAKQISHLLNTIPFLETEARKEIIINGAQQANIIHLAAHAVFQQENPLFSGIALSDNEWLTTLDIFNLKLDASLVTISACETGRGIVGGGDELLGIMRALLAAGAASAVLSLWAVVDQSTEILMETFYSELIKNNQRKDAALRAAQLTLLNHENPLYHHPFFWAPFFLVGANDQL